MLKRKISKVYWVLAVQFGFDVRRFFLAFRALPRFIVDSREFRQTYEGELNWMPCLHDRLDEAGSTRSEYFWQDLLVARSVYEANPRKHVDVGSRIDGFVAHVASFREIEVFDVRPVSTVIPGIVFKQADFMTGSGDGAGPSYCDSLSCLHALEHFGLGRYGDPLDPDGGMKGLANMARLLQPGGTFYLSTPVGRARVEFNAHRVFDPRQIIEVADANGLMLRNLMLVEFDGTVRDVETNEETLRKIFEAPYHLGMFTFAKR